MKTLIVDIGGNSAKPAIHSRGKIEKLERLHRPKHEKLKPGHLVGHIMNLGVSYDHVVLGYPGVVKNGVIVADPVNLKDGWKGYDFVSSLFAFFILSSASVPTKSSNDLFFLNGRCPNSIGITL